MVGVRETGVRRERAAGTAILAEQGLGGDAGASRGVEPEHVLGRRGEVDELALLRWRLRVHAGDDEVLRAGVVLHAAVQERIGPELLDELDDDRDALAR